MKLWFAFALSAALFWGAYVVTISYGQAGFGGKANPNSPLRAFLFIGIAYFIMAIIIPGLWLLTHPVQGDKFTLNGATLSTLAGILGALGALAVIFAIKSGGSPTYIAPVVFSGAPIINVLLAWALEAFKGKAHAPSPMFFVGLALAVAGTVTVLLNSPVSHAPAKTPATITPAPTP